MSPAIEWTWSPGVVASLVAAGAAYVGRWRAVRRRQGAAAANVPRLAAFSLGLLLLGGALVSPLNRLAGQLLVLHVVQHVAIFDFAAILLVLGGAEALWRPVAPRRLRHFMRRRGLRPLTVLLYAGSLWVWHIPPLYDLALERPALHLVQHLHLLLAGAAFWWWELSAWRDRDSAMLGALAYVGAGKLLTGTLASLLAFSPAVLFDFYAARPRVWDLSALEDQQLEGAVLILVETLFFVVALAALFIRMLGESDRDDPLSPA